jgi:hypothetical protein
VPCSNELFTIISGTNCLFYALLSYSCHLRREIELKVIRQTALQYQEIFHMQYRIVLIYFHFIPESKAFAPRSDSFLSVRSTCFRVIIFLKFILSHSNSSTMQTNMSAGAILLEFLLTMHLVSSLCKKLVHCIC